MFNPRTAAIRAAIHIYQFLPTIPEGCYDGAHILAEDLLRNAGVDLDALPDTCKLRVDALEALLVGPCQTDAEDTRPD